MIETGTDPQLSDHADEAKAEVWCKDCWTEHRPNCDGDIEHCKEVMAELYSYFNKKGE